MAQFSANGPAIPDDRKITCDDCGAKAWAKIRRDRRDPANYIQFDELMGCWTFNGGSEVVSDQSMFHPTGRFFGQVTLTVKLTQVQIGSGHRNLCQRCVKKVQGTR